METPNAKILVVDDEEAIRALLSAAIKGEGLKSIEAPDGETALEMIKSESPDVMLLDIRLPDISGLDVLRLAKEIDPNLSVIVLTGYAETPGAVKAMKAGAFDYLSKPFEVKDILKVIYNGLDERRRKLEAKEHPVQKKNPLQEAMGPSDVVERVLLEVNRVAESDFTVVIIGETGSGKELIARTIHEASSRSGAPFVAVDCGAIPETLLESELFGHEKGAFTGAETQKAGKFELAQGGTLFLDEISNMPLGSQAKLLRVLQEKKVYRVGGTKPIEINVRLLVAGNQDLQALMDAGSFRRDLFYRLNEFSITVPPLRERKEDIPYLAKRFLDLANAELRKNVKGFSGSALDMLLDYPWPGNVRQLRSTIRRATLLADEEITNKHLDLKKVSVPGLTLIPKVQGMQWQRLSLQEIVQRSVDQVEREVLVQVLNHAGGNKAKAARLLQIDYKTMHTKLKRLGIWETRLANGNQGTDLEPGRSDHPGAFDLTSGSQPHVLKVDALRTRKQRRVTLAA
jgi:DNA-binding NtrC family response regulator